jgi:hypothetical protein
MPAGIVAASTPASEGRGSRRGEGEAGSGRTGRRHDAVTGTAERLLGPTDRSRSEVSGGPGLPDGPLRREVSTRPFPFSSTGPRGSTSKHPRRAAATSPDTWIRFGSDEASGLLARSPCRPTRRSRTCGVGERPPYPGCDRLGIGVVRREQKPPWGAHPPSDRRHWLTTMSTASAGSIASLCPTAIRNTGSSYPAPAGGGLGPSRFQRKTAFPRLGSALVPSSVRRSPAAGCEPGRGSPVAPRTAEHAGRVSLITRSRRARTRAWPAPNGVATRTKPTGRSGH